MNRNEVDQYWAPWDSIKERHDQDKEDKGKIQEAGIAPKSTHYIVAHCNIGIHEITSFSYYKDTWILNIGVLSHMTFIKYCFE